MHFETLNIRGFGCLSTRVEFSPDKLNLTIANNETGKSTLVSAILAAFYGIVEDRRERRDPRPMRWNVIPWERPEEFGVELDFVLKDTPWRIERDFNSGEVHLINRNTGQDKAPEYHIGRGRYQIGEKLLDLSVDAFLKSFYLRQEEFLSLHEAGDLTYHIQQVATALEGGTTSAQAIERLRTARDNYPYISLRDGAKNQTNIKVENAIKRLNEERGNIQKEIEKLVRDRQDLEPQIRRLEEIEQILSEKLKKREEMSRSGDIAKINDLNNFIEHQIKLHEEVASLQTEAEQLAKYDQFPATKWEQLIGLQERIKRLEAETDKLRERLQIEGITPLEKVESELQARRNLAGITEVELREFESAAIRYQGRAEQVEEAQQEVNRLNKELKDKGIEREKYTRLKHLFSNLSIEEKRFLESFRAFFAEAESLYREHKNKREWIEHERELVLVRQKRIMANARIFFLLSAISILIGGMLIFLTQGEWLGQVLAGLGVVFGAVGAITRGTAGGTDGATLRKLSEELVECVKNEDDARARLDNIENDVADIANRCNYQDSNALLVDYFQFNQLTDEVEPLLIAEANLEKAKMELKRACEAIEPFFNRAGQSIPNIENLTEAIKQLLEQYRQAIKYAEEYKKIKTHKNNLESELERLKRDLESNRTLLIEILKIGGIEEFENMDSAVAAFREALDKHNKYRLITNEKLPRARQELISEVDLAANRSRLAQLKQKVNITDSIPPVEHSEEFYREEVEHLGKEIDNLKDEQHKIQREIAHTIERYDNSYSSLRQRLEELEDEINRAETFRADIDTAAQIMSDISREVYRNWATALSEETAPFISALNPRYSDLLFDEHLNFTILDRYNNRRITSQDIETILSTGARDEVFLAARLGVACYLSRGVKGPLPILLDEPLSSVDDEKFLSSMRFFLETLSNRHQVLILSCHEERHRWLKEQIPELFDQRVKIVEL